MSDLIHCIQLRRDGALLTFLVLVTLGLTHSSGYSTGQSILGIPKLTGPSEAVVRDIEVFECSMPNPPKNESILLQLFKTGNRNKSLGEYTSLSGEPGVFTFIMKVSHEGGLECVARAQNNTHIQPTVSRTHHLRVVEPVKETWIDVSSGQTDMLEGERLEMFCRINSGNHVTYKWLLDGVAISPSPARLLSDNRLLIDRTSFEDSGSYVCVASNDFNQTVLSIFESSEVEITIGEAVSPPDISFTVLKEDSQLYALVTCQSARGTPPISFTLFNGTEDVDFEMSLNKRAEFKVPLVLDQYMGQLQCQAFNGLQDVESRWLPLQVESVGGPVTLRYEYDIGENFAVVNMRLYCHVAKGSYPRFQWFLNRTLLHDRGSFYYVLDQLPFSHSILLLSVGRSSAGTYHCKVSNSFDNSAAIRSRAQYFDKEVLNRLPLLVVAVVFGCFTALILLVCVCCGIGVVYRQRGDEEKFLSGLEMESIGDVDEISKDELDLHEYEEDAGVVTAARGDEFDQPSEASVDAWPEIAEWKKMLEDEALEIL